jgi:hypothetical protein
MKGDQPVPTPTTQSTAALALITSLMAYLKDSGKMSMADTHNVIDHAPSLLREVNPSFNDVAGADQFFDTIRDILKKWG